MSDPLACLMPAPRARQTRGFADLKRSDPQLYRRLRGILQRWFDQHDWGYKRPGVGVLRSNKKDVANFWLSRSDRFTPKQARPPRIRPLSLRRWDDHCRGTATHYYTSSPTSGWALLLLDVDDKDGTHGDSDRVLDFFSLWFTSMYREVSTGGKGAHGYIVVRWEGMSVDAFRAICQRFSAVMAEVVSDHDFGAEFDAMKAVPGSLLPNGEYAIMGSLAKLPRLATVEQMREFVSCASHYHLPSDLEAVCEIFRPPLVPQPEKAQPNPAEDAFIPPTAPSHSLTVNNNGYNPTVPIVINGDGGGGEAVGVVRDANPRSSDGWSPNPAERIAECGRSLSRQLGRAATAPEILSEYERRQWHTGTDADGNRVHLAVRQANWLVANYRSGGGFECDKAETLALVRSHVTEDHRAKIRKTNRSAYSDEQLAAVLYTVELASLTRHRDPRYQFGVPNTAPTTMCAKLGCPLDAPDATGRAPTEDAQRRKLAAMKQVLALAGLVEVRDPTWRWGGKAGRGKLYGLGPGHPRRSEYEALAAQLGVACEPAGE